MGKGLLVFSYFNESSLISLLRVGNSARTIKETVLSVWPSHVDTMFGTQ